MTTTPEHVTSDDGRDIQLAVHEIAKNWVRRGFCPTCIARQIVLGASAVAQDAANWPADAVHETVDDAFSADTNHIQHREH
jgi:hypothetical protein